MRRKTHTPGQCRIKIDIKCNKGKAHTCAEYTIPKYILPPDARIVKNYSEEISNLSSSCGARSASAPLVGELAKIFDF